MMQYSWTKESDCYTQKHREGWQSTPVMDSGNLYSQSAYHHSAEEKRWAPSLLPGQSHEDGNSTEQTPTASHSNSHHGKDT